MSISPTASIHPTAEIAGAAQIGENVRIGPFSIIGPEVVLGPHVEVKSHAVVTGWTEVGEGTTVFPFSCIGEVPQDLKFKGERTRLIIGKRNRIREGVTINSGTDHGGGITRVGDDCLFMTGSHVGHDCTVGNSVIMANCAALGGHCQIGDNVIIGGLSGVHQWVRIGKGAFIGALTMVNWDVIPYGFVKGPGGELFGPNLVGLRRKGIPPEDIKQLRRAYNHIAAGGRPFGELAREVEEVGFTGSLVADLVEFVRDKSDDNYLPIVNRSPGDET